MDHLQKTKIIQKNKEAGDSQYIYPIKLDKVCFQYDMIYRDFKDLISRTASNKMLCDKEFNIAKIQNMMDIKGELYSPYIVK